MSKIHHTINAVNDEKKAIKTGVRTTISLDPDGIIVSLDNGAAIGLEFLGGTLVVRFLAGDQTHGAPLVKWNDEKGVFEVAYDAG